jgi:hypothetical protein
MILYQYIGIAILMLAAVITTLMVIYRKTYFVKITWRYNLILIPIVILVVAKLFSMKKKQVDSNTPNKPNFIQAIDEVQARITEVNQTTAIEVAAIKTENKVKLEELKAVTKMKDDAERRKRIAEMMG